VWEGDVVLTKFMAQDLPRDYWKGKNVLELGAGTGLAGMVVSILGAERVAITDGDERVLELARRNIAANLLPAEQAAVDIAQLRWEMVRPAPRPLLRARPYPASQRPQKKRRSGARSSSGGGAESRTGSLRQPQGS
jgi:ribosomal protein L11 methylase PrmA